MKIKSLILSIMMVTSTVAAPAALMANESIQAGKATTSSSIEDSNVYWDLYYMFKDKWLEEWNTSHPEAQRTEFNPFYLSPNYGDYHGSSSYGRLLCMYPYDNDIFIYTWQDNSRVSTASYYDGSSIHIVGTTNKTYDETGYLDEGTYHGYLADLVNNYNYTTVNSSNFLAKYVIRDVIDSEDGQEFYRFMVQYFYLYVGHPNVPMFKIDCEDEILYNPNNGEEDFNYHYSQPDHINITAKTGALWLSGESLNWNFFYNNRVDKSNVADQDGNMYQGYKNYDENFYAFFNVGSYSLDGEIYDEAIKHIEKITYSYVLTEYSHISSQWRSAISPETSWAYTGLYDNSYLNDDAYFTNVKQPVSSGDLVVDANDVVTYDHFLYPGWWFEQWYSYSTLSIIDCSGDTNIPSNSEFDGLRDFVKQNRQFDSDGDGTNDKQYRWAFKLNTLSRTSEDIDIGYFPPIAWGKFKTKAHQLDDITILKLKFINSDNLTFDLLAMDVNTPTTVVSVITAGRFYKVIPEWIQDIIDFFVQNQSLFTWILIAIAFVIIVIAMLYVFQPFMTIASNASLKRKMRKNNKK